MAGTLATAGLTAYLGKWTWLESPWIYLIVAAMWVPWLPHVWRRFWQARAITRNVGVGKHVTGQLRRVLMSFATGELAGQPLPTNSEPTTATSF